MFDVDWAELSPWDLWLYAFAAYCCVGLVWFWFRFQTLERAAKSGGPEDVARFNAILKGFPNSIYAKMLGRRALEADELDAGRA